MIFLHFLYGNIDKMVYLPSEVIENIFSFLGGEKYLLDTEAESTTTKILRQTDFTLREMMIYDVVTLLAKKIQKFICEQHEENYKKFKGAREEQRSVAFESKTLSFFVVLRGKRYTIYIGFSPVTFNPFLQFKIYSYAEPRIFDTKILYNVNVEKENTFIYSDEFLTNLSFNVYDDLCEILKIK